MAHAGLGVVNRPGCNSQLSNAFEVAVFVRQLPTDMKRIFRSDRLPLTSGSSGGTGMYCQNKNLHTCEHIVYYFRWCASFGAQITVSNRSHTSLFMYACNVLLCSVKSIPPHMLSICWARVCVGKHSRRMCVCVLRVERTCVNKVSVNLQFGLYVIDFHKWVYQNFL